MKKAFVLLLCLSVAVWSYVVYQFVWHYFHPITATAILAPKETESPLAFLQKVRSYVNLPSDSLARDPFQPYLYAQRPAPPASKVTAPKVIIPIDPPLAVINGILWGDVPMAILKQDNATELVKAGSEVWDFKVIKVERHQVTVSKQGRQFVIGY